MCLEISSFDLGKYIFDNPTEADMIDQILQSYLAKAVNEPSGQSYNKNSHLLPCLDTYIMKSNMLKEVLMKEFMITADRGIGKRVNAKNQWDVVREIREKILARIQSIEEGLARGNSQANVLREELKSMKKKNNQHQQSTTSHIVPPDDRKYQQMLSRMQSSSLEYLNTTDDEVQRQDLKNKLNKRQQAKQPSQLKSSNSSAINVQGANIKEFVKSEEMMMSTDTMGSNYLRSDQEFLQDSLQDLISYAKHPLRKVLAEEANSTIVDTLND